MRFFEMIRLPWQRLFLAPTPARRDFEQFGRVEDFDVRSAASDEHPFIGK
jgi:hypothetical protein